MDLAFLLTLLFLSILFSIFLGKLTRKNERRKNASSNSQSTNFLVCHDLLKEYEYKQVDTYQKEIGIEAGVNRESEDHLSYERVGTILSVAERKFYSTLIQATNKLNLLLLVKVRMEDIVRVQKGSEGEWGLRNRIKSRHTDFVLCDPEMTRPLLGIELDDRTHEYLSSRIERDRMVDKIFKSANMPLWHVRVSHEYNLEEIEKEIRSRIGPYL